MPENKILGLSAQEVEKRIQAGDINVDAGVKTRSVKQIVRENICTLFNLINVILACLVLTTGSFKNMLFMIVIVCNTIIGIVQEVRSKRITDRLSIIAGNKVAVIRDGMQEDLPLDQLVRDDVIVLKRGNQVPADCVVLLGECYVNESLLTGESNLIKKQGDSSLMSGSFINSGTVYARVEHVGAENYAAKISSEAKEHKAVNSQIMNSLNGIIKFVSCIMLPLGALLFASEYFMLGVEKNSAILSTTSALVGMIPEGLILLTSTVLAVAVVRLASSKVLVQQLYCIETLARVDTLCLDKTGTITTGNMEVAWVKSFVDGGALDVSLDASLDASHDASLETMPNVSNAPDAPDAEVHLALASIAASDDDPNETSKAISEYYEEGLPIHPLKCVRKIAFSSEKKWSGAVFEYGGELLGHEKRGNSGGNNDNNSDSDKHEICVSIQDNTEATPSPGTPSTNTCAYVMGAAQFIMGDVFENTKQLKQTADELAADARVLMVARVDGFDKDGNIIGVPTPIGFVGIQDQIRQTAHKTIEYFKEQGVRVIVISGDDPKTVSGIAAKVGVENSHKYIDATTLNTQDDIEKAIGTYSVFGRVKPEQKKAFVLALQKEGHTVAMTGDGVNDTLALKAADCSVAMASGSDAARNVAQLVLVNNDFASMPKVVAEGRRSINNLQRSASLFLVKTLLSITCALLFVLLPWQYPFQPIQMTLISAFTIGIPSFVLALEPNHDRIKGKFLENVIVRSIPGAICAVAAIIAANALGYSLGFSSEQVSTLCVFLTSWLGINLVVRLSIPYTPIRAALLVVIICGLIGGYILMPNLFALTPYTQNMWIVVISIGVVCAILFHLLYWKLDAWHSAKQAKLV